MYYEQIILTAIITAAVMGAIFWVFLYPAKVEPEVREVTARMARDAALLESLADAFDGIQQFVNLLDRMPAQTFVILFTVPGAAFG